MNKIYLAFGITILIISIIGLFYFAATNPQNQRCMIYEPSDQEMFFTLLTTTMFSAMIIIGFILIIKGKGETIE